MKCPLNALAGACGGNGPKPLAPRFRMEHRSHSHTDRQSADPTNRDGKIKLRRWLERLHDGGNWFPFLRAFYLVLPKLTALFLQDLLNLSKAAVRDGEWCLATGDYLVRGGWSADEQDYHFRILKRAGFVATERRGCPPMRWICIDLEAIHTALDAAELPPDSGNTRESIPANFGVNKSIPKRDAKRKTQSGVEPPDGVGNPDVFPMPDLFGNETSAPPPGTDYSPFDLACAERLWTAVSTRTQRRIKSRKSRWANEFRLLRESIQGPDAESRITAALDWYTANINGAKVPEAFCGAAFREKFDRIEAAMKRAADPSKPPAFAPESVTVSPHAADIARRVTNSPWPGDSERQVPALAQVCLDNLRAFLKKLRVVAADKSDRGAQVLAVHIDNQIAPLDYVEQWCEDARRSAAAWRNWRGDLAPFVWTMGHKSFVTAARGWAAEYGGPAAWDRLAAILGGM